jgi:hypothetical protein
VGAVVLAKLSFRAKYLKLETGATPVLRQEFGLATKNAENTEKKGLGEKWGLDREDSVLLFAFFVIFAFFVAKKICGFWAGLAPRRGQVRRGVAATRCGNGIVPAKKPREKGAV